VARRYKHSLEEIKAMILQSAESIVTEEGHAALNARKIAIDIGYTVGSIYMVFDSMADVLMHVNAKTLDEMTAYLKDAQNATTDTPFEDLAQNYLRFARQNLNRWRLLFEYVFPHNKSLPLWYQQHIDNTFASIAALVTTGLPKRTDINSKLAIQSLWGGIHGIYTLSVSNKLGAVDSRELESSVLLLVRSFIAGWTCHSR
jgi:AcrR family transcriptional regulator